MGIPEEKILAVEEWRTSDLFDERERIALSYAEAITYSDQDVDDALFEQIQAHFDDAQIVELTMTIAWENASSKFNHALLIPAQGLWDKVIARRQEQQARRAERKGRPRGGDTT